MLKIFHKSILVDPVSTELPQTIEKSISMLPVHHMTCIRKNYIGNCSFIFTIVNDSIFFDFFFAKHEPHIRHINEPRLTHSTFYGLRYPLSYYGQTVIWQGKTPSSLRSESHPLTGWIHYHKWHRSIIFWVMLIEVWYFLAALFLACH